MISLEVRDLEGRDQGSVHNRYEEKFRTRLIFTKGEWEVSWYTTRFASGMVDCARALISDVSEFDEFIEHYLKESPEQNVFICSAEQEVDDKDIPVLERRLREVMSEGDRVMFWRY